MGAFPRLKRPESKAAATAPAPVVDDDLTHDEDGRRILTSSLQPLARPEPTVLHPPRPKPPPRVPVPFPWKGGLPRIQPAADAASKPTPPRYVPPPWPPAPVQTSKPPPVLRDAHGRVVIPTPPKPPTRGRILTADDIPF